MILLVFGGMSVVGVHRVVTKAHRVGNLLNTTQRVVAPTAAVLSRSCGDNIVTFACIERTGDMRTTCGWYVGDLTVAFHAVELRSQWRLLSWLWLFNHRSAQDLVMATLALLSNDQANREQVITQGYVK